MENNRRLNDIAKKRRKEFVWYCIAAALITVFMNVL